VSDINSVESAEAVVRQLAEDAAGALADTA
jgi:hypothetical protein